MSFPGAPFKLSVKDRTELINYWEQELSDSLIATQEREQCLKECICLYLAEPPSKSKNFPWKGAANIVIPLIGITVDSIVARIVNTIFAVEPFWKVSALTPEYSASVRSLEDFMEWSRKTEFDWYKAVKTWAIEIVQCGTSWMKYPWEISDYATYEPTPDGSFKPFIIKRRRPNPMHVLDVDIIRQCGVLDETQAEWMGHRYRLTNTQVYQRFMDGSWSSATGGMVDYKGGDKEIQEILDQKEDLHISDDIFMMGCCDGGDQRPRLNTFYELYAKMCIPGSKDHTIHDVVITYHKPTKRILRAIYNPIAWGERILKKGRFIEVLGRSKGLGIAKQLKYMQDEITTIHCQQLDNATIANTRFFLGRRGRIKDGTRIWPGRVLTTPDPEKDLKAIQMGDIYQSMRALEQSVLAFAERRSGVSDYSLGRESSVIGDRATATGTMAIIQEGNRRFDLNVRDLRDSLGDGGRLLLQLNQQFRPRGTAYYVQGEKGLLTEKTLDMPQEYIAHKLGVELSASTATINRQVEQQGLTALLGVLMQHMQTGQQAALMMMNPQISGEAKEFTAKSMAGVTEIVKRITQTNDMRDLDMLVPMLGPGGAMQNGGPSGAMQLAGALGPVGGTPSAGGVASVPGIPNGTEGSGV